MNLSNPPLLLLVTLAGIVIASGCTGGFDPTTIAKANPMIKEFMNEHPNAEITVSHYSGEQAGNIIQQIRQDCGNQYINPKEFYRVKMTDKQTNFYAIAWVDAKNKIVECAYKWTGGNVINNQISCQSNNYSKCDSDNLYWFDSCGNREQIKEKCENGCARTVCLEFPPTCTNECSSSGTKQCLDSAHYRICGNYDSDSCLEWSSQFTCSASQTCSDGQCGTICKSHEYFKCENSDLYWFDSCNQKQDEKEYCIYGCESDICIQNPTNQKRMVILIIDEYLYKDNEIKSRIDIYREDNADYEFANVIFNKTNDSIIGMEDTGGIVKHNSLEVRNIVKQIYNSPNSKVVGIWIIGNIRPTIWRDVNLWMSLGQSGFYPSVYPLTALGDYYGAFDVKNDGFYEKEGLTKGSEIGGGYNATIWAAALIPPTFDNRLGKELIKDFFDRDHAYNSGTLRFDKKLLYSDIFGCSSDMVNRIQNMGWQATILCPNFNDNLEGFNSVYQFAIHNNGPDYDPNKVGWTSAKATTDEEKSEYENWIKQEFFVNSVLIPHGGPYDYYFILSLKGRSTSAEKINNAIKNNLPSQICSRIGNCDVFTVESGFEELDGGGLDRWDSYPQQRENWNLAYNSAFKQNSFEVTYLSVHGSPTNHYFYISSNDVKNSGYHSLIYEIEACNTGNYLAEDYIAGTYLFYGNALAVNAYSIPFLIQGMNGYYEGEYAQRFLGIREDNLVIESLFLKNYENSLYFGDPLLKIKE